ncbi:guanylate cyclase [Thraustotheca clavata]|uniref:Guanylate cyclase n=1 Tax=Thraustotheca clavata TaxID=74557 RepID=A0A1V9Y4D0_9STRA|nr:guanylate cyclase [Thraustotheca clavata]
MTPGTSSTLVAGTRIHPAGSISVTTSRGSVPVVERHFKTLFSMENFSMDDVALHFISLAFIRISANKVMLEVEAAFAEHYATIQKKLHVRGIVSIILFLIGTIVYDYAILVAGVGTSLTSNQTIFKNAYSMTAFYVTLAFRFGAIIPMLVINIWSAYFATFTTYIRWTWISHLSLGCYPIVYNKLTSDYGVSWFCLFIMYFYSCTPIPFFHMMIYAAMLLLTYAAVMLTGSTATATEQAENAAILREWLYAVLFFVLVSFPSQSREFAIRVSYMSETMLLFQQNKVTTIKLNSLTTL